MKTSHSLGLAVALALGVAGCGKSDEPKKSDANPSSTSSSTTAAAPAGATVTIAHAGPLTGSIAHQGKDDENGVALAIEQANAKGLRIGGKPVRLRMMSEDDQGDPKIGTTVAQKFVDAKVAAVEKTGRKKLVIASIHCVLRARPSCGSKKYMTAEPTARLLSAVLETPATPQPLP